MLNRTRSYLMTNGILSQKAFYICHYIRPKKSNMEKDTFTFVGIINTYHKKVSHTKHSFHLNCQLVFE